MAAGYSQHFTLADIFNNKSLRSLIPLVNYRETVDKDGKTHRTTHIRSISRFVYDKSVQAARPYYEPLEAHKEGNTIIISGTPVSGQEDAVEAIYGALVANKFIMELTVNNSDMIRDALKEGERTKPAPKLYLRQVSMEQIKAALGTKKGREALLQDIMQNLYYSPEYAKTQEKYGVQGIQTNSFSYERNRARWARKVGAE